MARYISRIKQDVRILRSEHTELIVVAGGGGTHVPIITKPELRAEFRPGLESSYEMQYAIAHFTGRLNRYPDGSVSFGDYLMGNREGGEFTYRLGGALPEQNEHVTAIPGMTSPLVTAAYDITQKMSTFDTAWPQWSKEDEAEAERLLDLYMDADYVKVSKTRVAPPWPTYDEMRERQGAHMAIPAMAKNGGFNPLMVIAYEQQFDEPKKGIIDGLLALNAEAAEQAAEDASLTVVVQ